MQSGEQKLLDSVRMSSLEMLEQGNCGGSQLLKSYLSKHENDLKDLNKLQYDLNK